MTAIIYPRDYFDASRADDFFDVERLMASDIGLPYALFDFDDAGSVSPLKNTSDVPAEGAGKVFYRGWQVPPERYASEIYPLLRRFGEPVTSPEEYALMHSFDGYGSLVEDLMVPSVDLPYEEAVDPQRLEQVFDILGERLFVKDYVKSVYGHTMLSRDAGTDACIEELELIRSSRGADFAGGFAFKQWHDFSEQVRLFVLGGKIVLAVPHDGIWRRAIPQNAPLSLPSPFYTADMAKSADDGKWYLVECGDGQVSDCGRVEAMQQLYQAIAAY